jgi:hypothetical protein
VATVLDLSLLQAFDAIFAWIFVFALVFGVLHKVKPVGDSVALNAIIGAVTAIFVVISDTLVEVISLMIPWFTIAIIFFVLLLLIFRVFGAKDADIAGYMMKDKGVAWTIIGIAILIAFGAFATVLGQSFTQAAFDGGSASGEITDENGVATADFQQNIYSTLFHPKVLGVGVLFIIVIFSVGLLTGDGGT